MTKKTVKHPTKPKPGYGWKPDLPDTRDRAYSAPMAALRASPPKEDQRAKLVQHGIGRALDNALVHDVEGQIVIILLECIGAGVQALITG